MMIELEHVSKHFGGKRNVSALNDVHLAIARAERVAIIGPSGSGKSTLLNLVGALDRPTSGEVTPAHARSRPRSAPRRRLAVWSSADRAPGRVTWAAIRGVTTVLLFLLLMRLYDELKDAATDLALGRSGDPLYRDRVLVTGAVRIEDIRLLRWAVTAALIILNLWPGMTWATLAFGVLFGVSWLSFHWFFWPAVSRHLLLAFVTHNPISLLLDAYVVALFADTFGADRVDGTAVLLLVGLWLPMAAWETSRKVRAPEDETSYSTYSRVLGWKTAAVLPALFSIGSAVALAIVGTRAGLNPTFAVVIVGACAVVVWRCALFRAAPSRRHADLKPWAMLYATVANVGLVAAVLISKRGL
jgi:energy-coupling factor transporter ATP-binding protein EcfA2